MENHDSRKRFAARLALLLAGLAVMAFGVALSIKAELGTSPISSLPYVTAVISGLSVGTTTIIVNSLFVLIQMILLRRNYEWFQLLQIGIAVVFGMLIDLFGLLLEPVAAGNYAVQWLLCAGGIVFVALGISIEVAPNLVPTAGEGLVLAVCQVTPLQVRQHESRAGRYARCALSRRGLHLPRPARGCARGHGSGGAARGPGVQDLFEVSHRPAQKARNRG